MTHDTPTEPDVPNTVAADADVYADRTVDEVKAVVRDAIDRDAITAGELEALYAYEAGNKARVTLTEWLAERIEDLGGTVPLTAEPADADEQAVSDADADDPRAGENPEPLSEAEADGRADDDEDGDGDVDYDPKASTMVTLYAPNTGYYEGVWFDDEGTQNMQWNQRLVSAVRDGPLELVAVRDETAIPPDLRP